MTTTHPLLHCVRLGLAACALLAGAAQAQTVVNIKGFGDGAGVGGAYGYPLTPGTTITMINPVHLSLKAGDYLLSDALGQPGALYDAWNYNANQSGTWDSHFYVAVQQGASSSYTLLLDALSNRDPACRNPNCSWSTEAQASAAFLATPAFRLHLAQDTVVSLSSTDYFLPDNLGGISVLVSAVPEPPVLALMLAGLGLVAVRRGLRKPSA
jgi:hypothetical protein